MKRRMFMSIGLVLLAPAPAWSMAHFPSEIQQHLGLAEPPRCILCHSSDAGGGAVSQPFGQAMLAAGLTPLGGESLTAALDKLEADQTDSDGDGTPDIVGLRRGVQPVPDKPPVEYGCGVARIAAPRSQFGWIASSLSLLTFGLLASRSSRKGRLSYPVTASDKTRC